MKIYGGCWSDIGRREVNQDGVLYRNFEKDGQTFSVCAVCDGVGGLSHGELASSYLTNQISLWFDSVSEWLDMKQVNPSLLYSHLKDAAENWNEGVREICAEQQTCTGSTMSLLMIIRECYYVIHVGDSRIYHFQEETGMERLTLDASVARMKNGRVKNYLDNFMGKRENLTFQALDGTLSGDEMFLVCTDGFYHNLTEDDTIELYHNCCKTEDVEEFCGSAVRKMSERGEKDNISVSVVMIKRSE